MSEIEEPTTTWPALVFEHLNTVVEWVGARGYLLMAVVTAALAGHAHYRGIAPGLLGRVLGLEAYLFVLGFAVGGGVGIAIHLWENGGGL